MQETGTFVIVGPTQGVAYQTAGALQRLGRRMLGIIEKDSDRDRLLQAPMSTRTVDWRGGSESLDGRCDDWMTVLFAFEPYVGQGRAVPKVEIEAADRLLQILLDRQPAIQPIIVLPEVQNPADVRRLHALAPTATTILTPAAFGFRDQALLDISLDLLAKGSPSLRKPALESPFRFAYSGDVAAWVVAAAQNRRAFGQILRVPALGESLEAWRSAFTDAFAKLMKPEGLAARLTRPLAAPFPGTNETLSASATTSDESLATARTEDVFASPATSLTRALSDLARHRARDAQGDLVFPPARGI